MTIHVNMHEAKTQLSKLVEAAERGEEVVIAKAGKAKVKLTVICEKETEAVRIATRKAFTGKLKGKLPEAALDVDFFEPTDDEIEE